MLSQAAAVGLRDTTAPRTEAAAHVRHTSGARMCAPRTVRSNVRLRAIHLRFLLPFVFLLGFRASFPAFMSSGFPKLKLYYQGAIARFSPNPYSLPSDGLGSAGSGWQNGPPQSSKSEMNKRPRQSGFLRKMGSAACLLAVLATLGGHWVALQSLAWVRMIVQYSQQGSFTSALAKTFDGRHPCNLCVTIQQGRQQEQQEHQELPWVRLGEAFDLVCDLRPTSVPLPPVATFPAVAFVPSWHADFIDSPLTPPPRQPAAAS
jgi:hypothetical protein